MTARRPDLTDEYSAETVAACEMALRSLLVGIGNRWRERVVVVGGMVPLYLYEEIPRGVDPHVGTNDLDIGIGVLVDEGDAEVYTRIERRITTLGFRPRDRDWRWAREVDGVTVLLEFLCPAAEADRPGETSRRPVGGSGNLYALAVRGIELVPQDCLGVDLEGALLDRGGRRSITARVANLLPFLMLKGFAIDDRVKEKDAYDVVWTLTAHPEGPKAAATLASESPIAREPTVQESLGLLRRDFDEPARPGPARFAEFEMRRLGRAPAEDLRSRLRRDAHGAVTQFLDAWDEVMSRVRER